VTGFIRVVEEGNGEVFHLTLNGQETAAFLTRASMQGNQTVFTVPFGINYTIQSAHVAPVPEPATLLLVASGLVGLYGRRDRHRTSL
jgi:hypothetical protein